MDGGNAGTVPWPNFGLSWDAIQFGKSGVSHRVIDGTRLLRIALLMAAFSCGSGNEGPHRSKKAFILAGQSIIEGRVGYHDLGCVKTFASMGRTFAVAKLQMLDR